MADIPEVIRSEFPDMPTEKAFELFHGKWNLWILYILSKKKSLRFGELRSEIPGISNTMLSNSLKHLEEFGLVVRTQYNEIPPHVEYSATEAVGELEEPFRLLFEWSRKYLA